jgi:hypothetical protein
MSWSELLRLTGPFLFVPRSKLLRLTRPFLLMSWRVFGRSLRKRCRGQSNRRGENTGYDFQRYHVLLRFELAVTSTSSRGRTFPDPDALPHPSTALKAPTCEWDKFHASSKLMRSSKSTSVISIRDQSGTLLQLLRLGIGTNLPLPVDLTTGPPR